MEETLHTRVIGQEEAVVAISRAIRRARVGTWSAVSYDAAIMLVQFNGQQIRNAVLDFWQTVTCACKQHPHVSKQYNCACVVLLTICLVPKPDC